MNHKIAGSIAAAAVLALGAAACGSSPGSKGTAGPTGKYRCPCYSGERSHKSSSRKVTHSFLLLENLCSMALAAEFSR